MPKSGTADLMADIVLVFWVTSTLMSFAGASVFELLTAVSKCFAFYTQKSIFQPFFFFILAALTDKKSPTNSMERV